MDDPQATATGMERARPAGLGLAGAAALAAAIVWSFYPSFVYLARWWEDSNYSHGWIIIPIALYILWQRRERLTSVVVRRRWWDFLPLVALLALRSWFYERNDEWLEAAMIPAVVAAVVLAVGGWGTLRWSLPGVVYLFFMVPLPSRFNDKLAAPLQRIATLGSVEVLKAIGRPVLAEGNVILIGAQHVEVAEACRGLSMLLAFAALITAMIILVHRPIWERVVLVLSIIPIALVCNIIRISVTAVAYAWYDRPVHEVHDYAGFAMMALALGFVSIELKLMSWLVVEERAVAPSSMLYGAQPRPR